MFKVLQAQPAPQVSLVRQVLLALQAPPALLAPLVLLVQQVFRVLLVRPAPPAQHRLLLVPLGPQVLLA